MSTTIKSSFCVILSLCATANFTFSVGSAVCIFRTLELMQNTQCCMSNDTNYSKLVQPLSQAVTVSTSAPLSLGKSLEYTLYITLNGSQAGNIHHY